MQYVNMIEPGTKKKHRVSVQNATDLERHFGWKRLKTGGDRTPDLQDILDNTVMMNRVGKLKKNSED